MRLRSSDGSSAARSGGGAVGLGQHGQQSVQLGAVLQLQAAHRPCLLDRARPPPGQLDQGRVADQPAGGDVAPPRLALAPGGGRDQGHQLLAAQLAAARHTAPGLIGILHQLCLRPVAPLHLLVRPAVATQAAQPLQQRIHRRQQVPHVVAGVGNLGGGQRPLRPVGEALGMLQPHAQGLVEHALQRQRAAQPREPGRQLGVEHRRGTGAEVQGETGQVGAGGVHRLDHRPVGDQVGNGLQRRSPQRVDHGQPLGGGDLDEAEHRRVRALPDELGVQRAAPLTAGVGQQRGQAGVVGDLLDAHRAAP